MLGGACEKSVRPSIGRVGTVEMRAHGLQLLAAPLPLAPRHGPRAHVQGEQQEPLLAAGPGRQGPGSRVQGPGWQREGCHWPCGNSGCANGCGDPGPLSLPPPPVFSPSSFSLFSLHVNLFIASPLSSVLSHLSLLHGLSSSIPHPQAPGLRIQGQQAPSVRSRQYCCELCGHTVLARPLSCSCEPWVWLCTGKPD